VKQVVSWKLYEYLTSKLSESIYPFLSQESDWSYHSNYYVPHNLSLVIVGNVDHGMLLQTLQEKVESSILSKGKPDLSGWKRYFPSEIGGNVDHG